MKKILFFLGLISTLFYATDCWAPTDGGAGKVYTGTPPIVITGNQVSISETPTFKGITGTESGSVTISQLEKAVTDDHTHYISGTYEAQVLADPDDCYVNILESAISLGPDQLQIGNHDSASFNTGVRWLNVDIPKNSVITTAYVIFTASDDTANDTCNILIRGEDSDNPVTFSTFEDFVARPVGSASVEYIPEHFINGSEYSSPELKTIIQEIVDRTGWASGNALALFFNDNSSSAWSFRFMYDYGLNPAFSPKLHVEYEYLPDIISSTGKVTLVDGTAAVNTNKVTADSKIFLTSQTDGGTPGWLRVSASTPGVSFTITSSSVLDTSNVGWFIIEPILE